MNNVQGFPVYTRHFMDKRYTVVGCVVNGQLVISYSWCHPKDRYNRKIGHNLAVSKLESVLAGGNHKDVAVFPINKIIYEMLAPTLEMRLALDEFTCFDIASALQESLGEMSHSTKHALFDYMTNHRITPMRNITPHE